MRSNQIITTIALLACIGSTTALSQEKKAPDVPTTATTATTAPNTTTSASSPSSTPAKPTPPVPTSAPPAPPEKPLTSEQVELWLETVNAVNRTYADNLRAQQTQTAVLEQIRSELNCAGCAMVKQPSPNSKGKPVYQLVPVR